MSKWNGYLQVSRRYRQVAKLPEDKTGIEAMRQSDPQFVKSRMEALERDCMAQYLRVYSKDVLTLTQEEFEDFLKTNQGAA